MNQSLSTGPSEDLVEDHRTELIFISIAAYRDPQLVPTLMDCIGKARYPRRLRFGICWQHDPAHDTLPFHNDDCFRILPIDWRESKGACWARSEIMKLWRGEPWYLQVDSHCRFAEDWDSKVLDAMQQTGSPKPILSTYASPFTPSDDEARNEVLLDAPLQMAFHGFTDDGIPHMKPVAIPQWQTLTQPRRARFLSAGFLFAPGSFVEEIGYDPDLYFLGEETALTLRAFTSGYDLFHPTSTLVWHDYGRPGAAKHWGDHTAANNISRQWHELDSLSKRKVRRLLAGQPVERYGLGAARTLSDYEAYAGLSLSRRKAQDYTVRSGEPPNPQPEPDWERGILPWIARITLERSKLPPAALEDPAFWYLSVRDEHTTEIYRQDIPAAELATLSGDHPAITLFCEFESGTIPASWFVWPVSRSQGWLRKVEGVLGEDDFSIVTDEPPSQ